MQFGGVWVIDGEARGEDALAQRRLDRFTFEPTRRQRVAKNRLGEVAEPNAAVTTQGRAYVMR
jgi:hypothetical protein